MKSVGDDIAAAFRKTQAPGDDTLAGHRALHERDLGGLGIDQLGKLLLGLVSASEPGEQLRHWNAAICILAVDFAGVLEVDIGLDGVRRCGGHRMPTRAVEISLRFGDRKIGAGEDARDILAARGGGRQFRCGREKSGLSQQVATVQFHSTLPARAGFGRELQSPTIYSSPVLN